jgi:RimJ/RimL family protein N-acetyltransferase
MLTISNDQMEALARSLAERFGREVVADLEHSAPDSIRGLDDGEIEARLAVSLRKCAQYKLEAQRDIRAYIRLCFVIGPNFDQYPPFLNELGPVNVHASVRLGRLFRSATAEDWDNAAIYDIVGRWRYGSHQDADPQGHGPGPYPSSGAGRTADVSLVPLGVEHIEQYFLQSRHPDVWRLGHLKPLRTIDETHQYFISLAAAPDRSAFAIIVGGTGFVGAMGIRQSQSEARIHYWVGRPFWGRGYATEAVKLGLSALERDLDVTCCVASINSYNLPSLAVARKAGFSVYENDESPNVLNLRRKVELAREDRELR